MQPLDPAETCSAKRRRRELHGERLEKAAQADDLGDLVLRDFRHDDSLVRSEDDEVIRLKESKRLSDRRGAHAELGGEDIEWKARSGLELAAPNPLPQLLKGKLGLRLVHRLCCHRRSGYTVYDGDSGDAKASDPATTNLVEWVRPEDEDVSELARLERPCIGDSDDSCRVVRRRQQSLVRSHPDELHVAAELVQHITLREVGQSQKGMLYTDVVATSRAQLEYP